MKPVPACPRLPPKAATISGDECDKSTWLESDYQIKEKARTFHILSQKAPKVTCA